MEYITATTHEGQSIGGFKISHQKELPKKAILSNCYYTNDFKEMTVYKSYSKTKVKTYILIKK
jgi:hypothetical protein